MTTRREKRKERHTRCAGERAVGEGERGDALRNVTVNAVTSRAFLSSVARVVHPLPRERIKVHGDRRYAKMCDKRDAKSCIIFRRCIAFDRGRPKSATGVI